MLSPTARQHGVCACVRACVCVFMLCGGDFGFRSETVCVECACVLHVLCQRGCTYTPALNQRVCAARIPAARGRGPLGHRFVDVRLVDPVDGGVAELEHHLDELGLPRVQRHGPHLRHVHPEASATHRDAVQRAINHPSTPPHHRPVHRSNLKRVQVLRCETCLSASMIDLRVCKTISGLAELATQGTKRRSALDKSHKG